MDRYLRELRAKLVALERQNRMQLDDMRIILSLARQHLEYKRIKRGFATLTLYCNWSLHTELDKYPIPTLMGQVTTVLNALGGIDYNVEVGKVLSLPAFFADMRRLLASEGVRYAPLESAEGRREIANVLVEDLLEKPWRWSGQPPTGVPFYAETLELYVPAAGDIDSAAYAALPPDPVFWRARIMPRGIIATGPLRVEV